MALVTCWPWIISLIVTTAVSYVYVLFSSSKILASGSYHHFEELVYVYHPKWLSVCSLCTFVVVSFEYIHILGQRFAVLLVFESTRRLFLLVYGWIHLFERFSPFVTNNETKTSRKAKALHWSVAVLSNGIASLACIVEQRRRKLIDAGLSIIHIISSVIIFIEIIVRRSFEESWKKMKISSKILFGVVLICLVSAFSWISIWGL